MGNMMMMMMYCTADCNVEHVGSTRIQSRRFRRTNTRVSIPVLETADASLYSRSNSFGRPTPTQHLEALPLEAHNMLL
jgi:hypothetical protein